MTPAVVLSAHVMGLAVIRGLGEAGVPVFVGSYDKRDMGTASRYAQEVIALPHPERQEASFVDALLALGRRIPGAVLFPANDAVLSAVARNREALCGVFRVASSGWESVRKFISKQHSYESARLAGVAGPLTSIP